MKFFRKLENLLSAAAFAEEGEFETAREMIREDSSAASSTGAPAGEQATPLSSVQPASSKRTEAA